MTATTPRAHTLPMQAAVNRLLRAILRTPVLGGRLLTIYVVGQKTGRRYSVPVAYVRHDGSLLVGTSFGWGRNLRTGAPVDVRLHGRRRVADVVVATDEASVVAAYAVMARANHAFANFNRIGLVDGEPDPNDLHLAWAAGARVVRLTPR